MLKTIPEILKEVSKNIRKLSAEQASVELAENNGLLIDVREPAEYAVSSATGAVNIPRGLLEMKVLELVKEENTPIYLHCASAARATFAAESLMRVGYTNVTVISCKFDVIEKSLNP
ncbi:rhodanese-like domain-containing protein [Thalassotalea psychrophila]|uniref:Rhodanese-like domain-containing protein n=1 Tax=Thalassotalea psychrophila TaxID=3065647 RepID=A0ABY9U3G6_9GAMM|nr:rhodanese-like domain-containing protein [Colwelliaceae bacterium SQ149]